MKITANGIEGLDNINAGTPGTTDAAIEFDSTYVRVERTVAFDYFGITGGTWAHNSTMILPSLAATRPFPDVCYDNTTGIFTAPISGNYMFYLSFLGGNPEDVYRYILRKNGEAVTSTTKNTLPHARYDNDTLTSTKSEYADNGAFVIIHYLEENDYVQVHYYADDATTSYPRSNDSTNPYPVFGGRLLS